MKLNVRIAFCALMLYTLENFAQVTPFSLPPRWHFGHRGGMNFTGGTPVLLNGNVWDAATYANQEGATSECLPNGNLHYYSNSCRLANGANANFGPAVLNGGGNSSTQGCISVPDPANPNTQFFLITTEVDPSGGSDCVTPARGVWAYSLNNTPAIAGAPVQLAAADVVQEVIAVTSDNNGGYWIISHGGLVPAAALSTYYAWHITAAGINTSPVTSTGTFAALEFKDQGGIKINKCNNRIAYVNGQNLEVLNWNAATGAVGASIRTHNVNTPPTNSNWLYGVEFSPDGNIVYMTDYQGGLYHYNTTTGVISVLSADGAGSSPGFGNLQIGPDDKIYIAQKYGPGETGPKYLGVISNPNSTTPAGCGYVQTGAGAFQLAPAGSAFQNANSGLITLGWHNPNLPITESTSPCMNFSYTYTQYYGATIPVLAGSQEWDFGDGGGWQTGLGANPTHNYASNGNYAVRLRVKDQNCQIFYTNQKSITVSCVLPVELIAFDAEKSETGILLSWKTAMEINNSHFEIQRSADGINFITIGTVKGNGNSSSIITYSFPDDYPYSGENYYRLVQHDYDGGEKNSNIISLNIEDVQIAVFPNPSGNNFNVQVTGGKQAHIIVTDILGRKVYMNVINESMLNFSFGDTLPGGLYTLQVHNGNKIKYHYCPTKISFKPPVSQCKRNV
ncbi:MAG: PKD domain-containing protein, partial [Cytophagaceae bacterium]|nr:PKD domain-containing protein [Cytophagaceae bacterium]